MRNWLIVVTLLLASKGAFADAGADDNLKIGLACRGSFPAYDISCVRNNLKYFEKLIFKDAYDNKLYAAQALLRFYDDSGNISGIERLRPRLAVYQAASDAWLEEYRKVCGCEPSGDDVSQIAYTARAAGYLKGALYLDQQGPDYAADAAYWRRTAKVWERMVKGPSALQQLAQIANGGFDAYAGTRGATVPQPAAQVTPLPVPAAQSLANCTEVNSYVAVKSSFYQQGGGGHCAGGVDLTIANHYGQAVACKVVVHKNGVFDFKDGFGGGVTILDSGHSYSNIVDDDCGSDTGQIEWACFPKQQEDASYCLEKKTDWR